MTSLTDVYDGGVGSVVPRRRRVLGAGVFAVGVLLVAVAVPLATTDLATALGLGVYEARELAGVLAGVGLPTGIVGVFAVLPAPRPVRAAAAIGASVSLFGVALFAFTYPDRWLPGSPALAALTVLVYSLGTLVTFWCLFAGVVTLKTRTDPGGTVHMNVTEAGTVRIVSDDAADGLSSVGLTDTPDGEVATQTADGRPTGDGGSVADPATEPEAVTAAARRGSPDAYCGNCAHFEYVRVGGELTPYCDHHDALMTDMEACDGWEANR